MATQRKATPRRRPAKAEETGSHPTQVARAIEEARAPREPLTFAMQKPGSRVTRRYELVALERVDDETLAVKARPLYKDAAMTQGRPKTVGFLRLVAA